MRWIAALAMAALGVVPALSAQLKPETVSAFEQYIRQTERRLDEQKGKLWAQENAERARRIRAGEVVVEPTHSKALVNVPSGLVHDWTGAAFLPGVTVEQTLAFVEDYEKAKQHYRPEVVDSRLVSRDGNHFRVFMRLLKKQIITVVLDTDHDVQYEKLGEKSWRSTSKTTRISEVDNAGQADERVKPAGTGQGFLWRLNSYWRFEEREGGTWIECQAVSLTRDIPTGLGWIVAPVIRNLPKDSLQNTLAATRRGLTK